jgi:putative DNA primase/helicase
VFFLSSINLNLGRQADESRTVILTLIPKTDNVARAAAFDRLKALHAEIMTPAFPAGLLARTLRLLPVIRENSEVFAQAIARAGQSRRLGDTIGVLLAGAWSLRSTRAASPLEADAFIAGTPWVQEAMTRAETIPEWQRAIAFLVQQPLRIVPSNNRPEDVPIGELLVLAAGMPADARSVAMDDAIRGLARAGIRVSYEGTDARVYVANTSEALGEMFAKRSWGAGWLATIARAPGAEKVGKTVAFGKHRSRALSLPLGHFVGEGEG